jgi:hypothetical protein
MGQRQRHEIVPPTGPVAAEVDEDAIAWPGSMGQPIQFRKDAGLARFLIDQGTDVRSAETISGGQKGFQCGHIMGGALQNPGFVLTDTNQQGMVGGLRLRRHPWHQQDENPERGFFPRIACHRVTRVESV